MHNPPTRRVLKPVLLAAAVAFAATLTPISPARGAEVPPQPKEPREPEKSATPAPSSIKKKKKRQPPKTEEPRAKSKRGESGPKATATYEIPRDRTPRMQKITAFPREEAAVAKAFAEQRRDQIWDAEKSARGPEMKDRWQTVLFHIRDLYAHPDPETCFWRVLAFYRLGEVARARSIRQGCEMAPRDRVTLDEEDVTATGLQPPGAVPRMMKMAGEPDDEVRNAAQPVVNPAAYSGPSPTPLK